VKSRTRWIVGVPAALLLVAQLVPVSRTNPPVERDVEASPEVTAILRRSCYDCHSHETVWGPHTYVAPISWLAAHDVMEGREELNFSRWGRQPPGKVAKHLREVLGEGEMPPWIYTLAHPAARLTAADQRVLLDWAAALAAQDGTGDREGERRRRRP